MGRTCPRCNPRNPNRQRPGVRSGESGFGSRRGRLPVLRVLPLRLHLLPVRLHFLLLHRLLRLPLPLLGVGRALPLVWALLGRASGDTEGEVRARRNHERTVRTDDARPRAAQVGKALFSNPLIFSIHKPTYCLRTTTGTYKTSSRSRATLPSALPKLSRCS